MKPRGALNAIMDITSARAAYRRYAKIYDRVFGGVFDAGRRETMSRINRRGGQRILEVGVGTGLSLPLHRTDNEIVGIDVSCDMLDIARRRAAELDEPRRCALLEMQAENLAFADASFDCVVAMYVMTVVADPQKAMSEFKRVCKPGGRIFIVNHFTSDRAGLRRSAELAMAPLAKTLGWHTDFPMQSLLSTANIEIISVSTIPPLGLFSLLECRKPVEAAAVA